VQEANAHMVSTHAKNGRSIRMSGATPPLCSLLPSPTRQKAEEREQ
jgi:hypothetical protein